MIEILDARATWLLQNDAEARAIVSSGLRIDTGQRLERAIGRPANRKYGVIMDA